ncbi:ABC transporter substrate-binding protein [Paenibacillus albus]|uniref:ABC transporter substrate-binding protein n=1 Tax=Paenibacillus albus TaxID=2495582 RepID=A0A3S8ZZV0_9BACL|nr:ABC transporter substrate-binding protein [Paenibacillus albus]AZN38998.1 ABC transporter substrate-binding protein [Paenibacillus albus]
MIRLRKIGITLIGLLLVTLLLSACGSNNNAEQNNASAQAETTDTTNANQPVNSEKAAFPRTIKDANGEVTIEAQPKKVAVVHWGYADSILLFDIPSVGLALPFTEATSTLKTASYKPYVDKHSEMKIIGENTQVNMEALLAYAPDLIIAGNAINKDILSDLSKISQTIVIDEQTTDVWSNWPALVTKFGEILGEEDIAAKYIADYNASLADGKAKLANLDGKVAFLQVRDKQAWLQGTNYTKPYYDGLGLKPPVSEKVDMTQGAEISLEGLVALDPDYIVLGYFNYSDKSMPAVTDEWEKVGVWNKLKAVQNGHVYSVDGQLALGYGPIGNSYGVKAVVDALSK